MLMLKHYVILKFELIEPFELTEGMQRRVCGLNLTKNRDGE